MRLVLSSNKKYNLLIVYVTQVLKNELIIEKFYVNEAEYEKYCEEIKGKIYNDFSYYYQTQKVKKKDFFKTFGINEEGVKTEDEYSFLLTVNTQLKNNVYQYTGGIIKPLLNYRPRMEAHLYIESDASRLLEYRSNNYDSQSDNNENLPKDFLSLISNIDAVDSARFRMYNVGQGNMSALFLNGSDDPAYIFDLGCSRKCKSAIDLLSMKLKGKESTIIISHFDNDHINMAQYLPLLGAKLTFIIPAFLLPTDIYKPNVYMLIIKALFNGNNIIQVPNNSIKTPYTTFNGLITFLQGDSTKKDVNQSTDENSHGLICTINKNGKQVLVPGDVLYGDLFTKLNKPLQPDYVVIPHHSCEYKNKIPTFILDLSNLIESFTFCTQHRGFHHPNKTHFGQYMVNNAKLIRLVRNDKQLIVFDGKTSINDSFYDVKTADYYDWIL